MASTIRGNDNFDSAGVGKNASAGSVGSYMFAYYTGSTGVGNTVAGSSLNPASGGVYGAMYSNTATSGGTFYASNANGAPTFYNTDTMSGTWKCMGNGKKSTTYAATATLWLRIS